MSRRFLFFLVPLLFLFFASAVFSQDPGVPDTVRVEQKLTAGPSQQITVQVYVINDATLGAFVIPLSFYNPDNPDVKCDSIHWATRFTSNPATMYAGSVGYENYVDTLNHRVNIWAVWYSTPFAAGNGPICTIYFSTGSTWKSDIGVIIDSTLIPPTNQLEFSDAATGNSFLPKYSPGCLGAALQVLSPNGGEVWYVGESKNILWRSIGFTGNVKLEYSTNSGTNWSTIIASTGNTGTYPWTVPNSPSATNKIRVSDASDASPKDASDANFSIPDFTIAGTPSSRVIDVGASTNYTVNLGYLYGFAHPLTLSVTGLPSGASAGFSPNPVNPPTASSTMNVSTTGSTPAGTYVLTVQGTGSQTHTTTVTLVVNAAPSAFTLVSPDSGSTISTLNPTLRWHKATDPDPQDTVRYTLYYDRESSFTFPYDSIPGIADTFRTTGTLSDDTVYYWKVKAVDKWGKVTWSSNTWNFRVYYPQQPNTFSLVSPTDRDTSWQLSDTLVWRKTTDPDPGDSILYDLYIDSRSGFPQPRVISDLKDTTYVFTGTDDSTYYWKVLAKDTNTSGRWSTQTTWRFYIYVPQAPNSFALVTPENDDTVILHPKLVWNKATDPDPNDVLSYKVFWSLDPLVYTDSVTATDTSYTLPGLMDDTIYYWKVRVKDRFNLTAWSTEPYRSFRALNVAPASFTLITPSDTAWVSVLTPTLRWHKPYDPDPSDPISYIIYYSLDNTFSVYDSTLSSDTSKVLPALFDDSTYFWKVKAKDSYGATSWSTPAYWRFHVYYPQQPNTFTLVLPLHNSTSADSVITFYWHSTYDPDPGDSILYDLYYADNPSFTGQTVISNLKDTSRTVTLRDDKSYYWKVLAKDINTSGRWSTDVFRVNTYVPQAPRAFSLRQPIDGDTLSSLDANLFWQKTTDPDPGDVIKYDLYYDTSETFTSPVIVADLNDTSYTTPQLEPGTSYWWKVIAKDTNTAGTWSTQTFTFFVPSCMPGSVNGDDKVNTTDVIYLINYLFKGGPLPLPVRSCGDVQCDGNVNVGDAIYLINYLFKGGPDPGC